MARFKLLSVAVAWLVMAAMLAGCNLMPTFTTTVQPTTATTTATTTSTTTPKPTTAVSNLQILGYSNVQAGVVGQSFVRQFPAAGGVPPYTWTLVSGTLPPGLSLTSNGRIMGTPTQAGTFSYKIRLTDSKGTSAECDITQNIGTSGTLNFVFSFSQTLTYNENQIVCYVPLVQGGKLPWTFTISGLPEGLTYDPETGLISGTTTTPGAATLTISIKDADGKEAVGSPVTVSLTVNPPKTTNVVISNKSVYEGTYIGIFSYEYDDKSHAAQNRKRRLPPHYHP